MNKSLTSLLFGIAALLWLGRCRPFEPRSIDTDITDKNIGQIEVPDGFEFANALARQVRIVSSNTANMPLPGLPFRLLLFREGGVPADTMLTAQTDADGRFEWPLELPLTAHRLRAEPLLAGFNPAEIDLQAGGNGPLELNLVRQFAQAQDRTGGTNYCLEFDGTDDAASFASLFPMHAPGNRTVMFWVKKHDNNPRSVLWSRPDGTDANRFNISIAGNWACNYRGPSGPQRDLAGGGFPLTVGTWTHIAITRTGNTYRFYQNGFWASAFTDASPNLPTALGWLLGGPPSAPFKGQLDDLQIWDKALWPSQIQAFMHTPPTGAETDLAGYWPFDEGGGDVALDLAPNPDTCNLGTGATGTAPAFVVSDRVSDSDGDGVPDNLDVAPTDASYAYAAFWPAQNQLGTLFFEDGFPYKGDYDMNDLVVKYRFEEHLNADQHLTALQIIVVLEAMGASYRNGFGIHLPIPASKVASVTGHKRTDQYINLAANGVEAGQSDAVIIAFDNGFDLMRPPDGGYVNTDPARSNIEPYLITITVEFTEPIPRVPLGAMPYNPFAILNRTRSLEVHLPGKMPTALADAAMFGTGDDDTNLATGKTYQTRENLPWALDMPQPIPHLKEKQPINRGFLKFNEWAESGGSLFPDWYVDYPGYRNTDMIY